MVFISLHICTAEPSCPPSWARGQEGEGRVCETCHPKFLQQQPALATAFLPTGVLGQVSKQLAETYWEKRRSDRFLFQIVAFWQMAKMNNRQLAFWMRGGIYSSGIVCCLGAVGSDCCGILWWLVPAGICHSQARSQGSCCVFSCVSKPWFYLPDKSFTFLLFSMSPLFGVLRVPCREGWVALVWVHIWTNSWSLNAYLFRVSQAFISVLSRLWFSLCLVMYFWLELGACGGLSA